MATDAPVILFDPAPRSAALIFAGDMQLRFERMGRVVRLEPSRLGKLAAKLVEATLPEAVDRQSAGAPGQRPARRASMISPCIGAIPRTCKSSVILL